MIQPANWHCPVCDVKCDSQHSFTVHIRQHNPTDHSHTCSICGKTLSSASSLDRHMLIHSGERPFKCKICNMTFTTNGNMHRHMRTHGMESNENDAPDSNNNGKSKSHQNSSHHRNLKAGYSSNSNKTATTTTSDGDNDQDDNNSTIINNNHHKTLGRKRGGGGKGKGTGAGVAAMMTTNDDETHPENLSSMTSSDINLAISSLLLLSSSSSSTTTTSNTTSPSANDETKVNSENDVLPLQPLSSSTPVSLSSSPSSPISRGSPKSNTLLVDAKGNSKSTDTTTNIPINGKNQKTLSPSDRSSHKTSSLTSSSFTSSLSSASFTPTSSSNGKKMNLSSAIAPTPEKLRKQKSLSQSTSHSKVESIRCNNLYGVSSSSLSKQHCTASSPSPSLPPTSPTTTSNTNSKSGIKRNNLNDDNNNGINSGYASIGFHDLTFTDFSSHKYPLIAQSFCEANIRKSSSPYHDFQCSNCPKAFPCASALSLHLQTVHPHIQQNETLSSSPFATPIDPTSLGLRPTNRPLFSSTFCHLCQVDLGSPVLFLTHQAIHQYESIFHAVSGVNLTTSARTATSSSSPPSSSSTTSSPSNFLKAIVTNPTINSPTTTTTTTTTITGGGKLPSINNDNADDDGINNGSSEEREEEDEEEDEEEEMDNDNDVDDHHSANSDNEKEQFLAMLQLYKKNKITLNNSNKINDKNNNINSLVKVHPSIDGSSSSLLLKDEKNHFDYPSYFINAKVTLDRFNIPSTNTTTTTTSNTNITKMNPSSNNNSNSLLAKSKLNLARTSSGKINGHSNSIKTKETKKRPNRGHTKGSHNYACNLCPYTSMDKSTLVRHLRTHNGERPFQCAICKYAFTTKANCERHVRKRHKKTSKPEIKSAMLFNAGLTTSSSQPLDLAVHALDLSYKNNTSSTTTTNQPIS